MKQVSPSHISISTHATSFLTQRASRFYQERRQLVIALHEQGINTKEIAQLAGVTTRRVNQILAAHRKEIENRHVEAASGR